MSKFTFYDPWGNMFDSSEQFIDFYNNLYFYNKDKNYRISGVTQNSKFVENEIDNLLKNGIKQNIDVIHILAWKLGKIKHKCSNNNFVYHSDWSNISGWDGEDFDDLRIYRYGKEFDVKELANYIIKNVDGSFENMDPQDILNSFVDNLDPKDLNGIGTVYLITLLYFITRSKYPIYDRFADIALKAIYENKDPVTADPIEADLLPDKPLKNCSDSDPFRQVVKNYLTPFKDKITEVFGYDKYMKNRDIDRALWVYGHLFSSNVKRNMRIGDKIIEKNEWIKYESDFSNRFCGDD